MRDRVVSCITCCVALSVGWLYSCGSSSPAPDPQATSQGSLPTGGGGAASATAGASASAGTPVTAAGGQSTGGASGGMPVMAGMPSAQAGAPAASGATSVGGAIAMGGAGNAAMGGSGMGGTSAVEVFALSSPSLMEGGDFADENTCDGNDTSPELAWTPGPEGTMSYAITFYDETGNFAHWAIWNIPSTTLSLAADIGTMPPTPLAQVSFANDDAYRGPCPGGPDPGNAHTYVFTIYALSTPMFFPEQMDASGVIDGLKNTGAPSATLSGSSLAGN